MERHEFGRYRSYVKAQRQITLRKISRGRLNCSSSYQVFQEIGKQHSSRVRRGICHGVRSGEELQYLETILGGKWIGTEIVKELCDGDRVICWDFADVDPSWVNDIDVIFSNALDHARDPEKAVQAWVSCLSSTGRLYVEWTTWHAKLGRSGNRADCFAASLEEYIELIGKTGTVGTAVPIYGDEFERWLITAAREDK